MLTFKGGGLAIHKDPRGYGELSFEGGCLTIHKDPRGYRELSFEGGCLAMYFSIQAVNVDIDVEGVCSANKLKM